MKGTSGEPSFFVELKRELKEFWRATADGWHRSLVAMRNWLREARGVEIDYVVMSLGGALPERAAPPRSFIERQLPLPSPPLSLEVLNQRLEAVADAANVRGVIFVFRGFSTGLATLQSVRQSIQRLQAAGKEAIVFTPYLDVAHYYVASAADRIVIPPSTQFEVLGLRVEAVFLKNALEQIGVHPDVVQISPYKTGANLLGEPEMTPEQREQLNWLLDEQYDMVTAAMAEGRGKSQEDMRQLIDQAPLLDEAALAAGLVDHLGYEDELPALLGKRRERREERREKGTEIEGEKEVVQAEGSAANEERAREAEGENSEARIVPWRKGSNLLLEKFRRRTKGFIGVVSLEGGIVMGPSRQPPIDLPIPFIGGAMAGEQTLVRVLRRAEQMDAMAALIFHVDSPGGSSLASDLIGREVERLSRKKPVLVYMGNVAASGGYYVSAPAAHIMSQPTTLTGSIGVWMARISTGGLFDRLNLNRTSLQRGRRADLYSDEDPMTEEEREIFWEAIADTYQKFKQVVANGRPIPFDELEPVCQGKVWSGRQALDFRLVDSHGDFVAAVRKAAEMAGLPTDDDHTIRVANIFPKGEGYLPPKPFTTDGSIVAIGRWLLDESLQGLSGRPLLLMPFEVHFR
ncbi:MAG TPA: signal peptide peptidase SppA [Anaerolineae bacterium]